MDYVMIERHLFDALLRGVRECCSALDAALSQWATIETVGLTTIQHRRFFNVQHALCSRCALPAGSATVL